MRSTKKLLIIGVALLCLPFFGAWTTAFAQQPTEQRYVGAQLISQYSDTETIDYISKTVVENISTDKGAPGYFAIDEMRNACGAVAGTVAVGFYDKYYTNMIPNWNSYYSNGNYRLQDGVHVPAVMRDLYARMKTNVVADGVSEDEFKTGLEEYVKSVGYDMYYDSVWNGSFDYTAFKNAVNNNKVTALFVKPSNVYLLGQGDGFDKLSSMQLTGNHIMTAYGYMEVRYVMSYGIRTEAFVKVISGLPSAREALYKIGSYVDSAYILEVR